MYNSVFLTEKTVLTEVKEFYNEYHSTVFYVVYSSFCCVENSIQERGMLCVHVCVRTCLYMHLHACTAHVLPMKQFSIGIVDSAYEFMFKSNCPYLNGAVYNCVTGRDRSS